MSTAPVGTDLRVGDPAPPMSSGKALAVAIYTGAVAVIAGVPQLIPGLDDRWKVILAVVGLVLTAGGAPVVAWLRTNTLTQPVQVIGTGSGEIKP